MTRRVLSVRLAGFLVVLLSFVVATAACGPAPEASIARINHPATLAGTTWQLLAVGAVGVPAGTTASLAFGPTDLSGISTCNAFGGPYAYDPSTGAIQVGTLTLTKRACFDPGFNGVESALIAALRGVTAATVDAGGRLVLTGSGADLVFGPLG